MNLSEREIEHTIIFVVIVDKAIFSIQCVRHYESGPCTAIPSAKKFA